MKRSKSGMNESRPQRRISVHQALVGGGSVADVLLWRKRYGTGMLLIFGTCLWLIFDRGGYSPLSFVANMLFLLVVILFFWAKSASLLNRPLPAIPHLEMSEDVVEQAADVIRAWVNRVLAVAHEIVICGNLRVLTQVAALLWMISLIGSLFSFVTFVYIGFVLVLSVPAFYDKHQVEIDEILPLLWQLVLEGYNNLDKSILRKIPVTLHKNKKTQ